MLRDKIVKTSKGFPAIWEQGGGMTRSLNNTIFIMGAQSPRALES